jgi:hypothetical protein
LAKLSRFEIAKDTLQGALVLTQVIGHEVVQLTMGAIASPDFRRARPGGITSGRLPSLQRTGFVSPVIPPSLKRWRDDG